MMDIYFSSFRSVMMVNVTLSIGGFSCCGWVVGSGGLVGWLVGVDVSL